MAEISKHLERAEKALQKGKLELAVAEYLAALELDPGNTRIKESVAELYGSLNDGVRAASLFSELLSHYAATANLAKASLTYKRLTRFRPALPEEAVLFAELNEQRNRRESVLAYETALQAYQSQSSDEDVFRILERLCRLEPNAERLQQFASVAVRLGRKREAAVAYTGLALVLQRDGVDATASFAAAYANDPSNAAAALGHGRAELEQGEAEKALKILEPLANYPSSPLEAREPYALALMKVGRVREAEPIVWDIFDRDPREWLDKVVEMIGRTLDAGQDQHAVELSRRLEEFQRKLGLRREFIFLMKQMSEPRHPGPAFLEYLATLYDSTNHEADMTATLAKLFDHYLAIGEYGKAVTALERAVEVDAYEAGHHGRLEKLRDKVDPLRLKGLLHNLGALKRVSEVKEEKPAAADQLGIVEDLLLQAELFCRYSLKTQAMDAVSKIRQMFPLEEETNERLREVCAGLGLELGEAHIAYGRRTSDGSSAHQVARISEVNRAIARQTSVKAVLETAASEIGKYWDLTRCIAGLCVPGKPPSVAVESATGMQLMDPTALNDFVSAMVGVVSSKNVLILEDDANRDELGPVRELMRAHSMGSVAVVSLNEGDNVTGVLVLESFVPRQWTESDLALLRTVADQTVLAVDGARLRNLVKSLDVTDEASGLLKRSSYTDVLLAEVSRANHQKTSLTLLLVELDSPTVVKGDDSAVQAFMQDIGRLFSTHLRQTDVAIRYAPTEIAVVLFGTPEDNAYIVIEKLRQALNAASVDDVRNAVMTTGLAEANLNPSYDAADIVTELINRVEEALSQAKMKNPGAACALSATGPSAWLQ